MPSSEVMEKFRKGKLRSGSKRGPKVRSAKQARAIQISEARAEGHDIPFKKGRKKTRKMKGRKSGRRSKGRRRGRR